MRFSRTNMRLAAASCWTLSREIGTQAAEFSITDFCRRNPASAKSSTYASKTAKIGLSLFKSSMGASLDLLFGQQSEEALDLVDPGRRRRREVLMPAGPLGEPVADRLGLVTRRVVHDDVH